MLYHSLQRLVLVHVSLREKSFTLATRRGRTRRAAAGTATCCPLRSRRLTACRPGLSAVRPSVRLSARYGCKILQSRCVGSRREQTPQPHSGPDGMRATSRAEPIRPSVYHCVRLAAVSDKSSQVCRRTDRQAAEPAALRSTTSVRLLSVRSAAGPGPQHTAGLESSRAEHYSPQLAQLQAFVSESECIRGARLYVTKHGLVHTREGIARSVMKRWRQRS